MKKNLLIASALLFFSNSVSSQQWISSVPPRGRKWNSIKIFDQNNAVIIGGNEQNDSLQTGFVTNDGGVVWNFGFDRFRPWIKSADFTDTQSGIGVGYGGAIIKTTDGGNTWADDAAPALHRQYHKIVHTDNQTFYIAGGTTGTNEVHTILKSTDGGGTWQTQFEAPGKWLRSIAFSSTAAGVAVGDSGLILRTTNAGTNWGPVSSPVVRNFKSITFINSQIGFIVGGIAGIDSISSTRTLLKTVDGGANWNVVTDEVGLALNDIDFIDNLNGYLVGDFGTLLKTNDGGTTWTNFPVTVPGAATENFLTLDFLDNTYGIVSGGNNSLFIYSNIPPPTVITSDANFTYNNTALVSGSVDMNGGVGSYRFVYTTDSTFQNYSFTPLVSISGDSAVALQYQLTNLVPNTNYYVYLKATSLGGTVNGDTLMFYSGMPYDLFQTLAATNITSNSAALNAEILNSDTPLSLSFEYGTTSSLGSEIIANPANISDTNYYAISANLQGLQANTTYYFRLRAITPSDTLYGATLGFYTGNIYTTLATLTIPIYVYENSANVYGTVSGFQVPASLSFEYGTTLSLGNSASAYPPSINSDSTYIVYAPINSLNSSTNYYYRIKATTAAGVYYGEIKSFQTNSQNQNILVQTASQVDESSAQLNGVVADLSPSATISFEYGLTLNLENEIQATPNAVTDTNQYSVYASISGLETDTMYYYRVKVTDGGNIYYSNIRKVFVGQNTIPNWDFENWTDTLISLPREWHILAGHVQSVQGIAGNGLQITNSGIALLGTFQEDEDVDGPIFVPIQSFTSRPDSLIFYANVSTIDGDSAIVFIELTLNTQVVAQHFFTIGNTNGQLQRFSFPISYSSALAPDSIVMGIISTNPFDTVNSSQSRNNTLLIDEIGFYPSSIPSVINGNFEQWFDYSGEYLRNWTYGFEYLAESFPLGCPIVTRDYFGSPQESAAALNTINYNGSLFAADITTASSLIDDRTPTVRMKTPHERLTGYYKFTPNGTDTMRVEVKVQKGGREFGNALFIATEAVSEFTPFEAVFNYYQQNTPIIPDSVNIIISTKNKRVVYGLSSLSIDKLRFDGFAGGAVPDIFVGVSDNTKNEISEIHLSPNPSNETVEVNFNINFSKNTQIKLTDAMGRIMLTHYFMSKIGSNQVTLNLSNVASGVYLMQIENENYSEVKRIVVIK